MRLILKGVTTLFFYLIGIFFIIPIIYFIPRQKNRICFIGRDKGLFLDNTKYLYLYLQNLKNYNSYDIFFLTEDKSTYKLLKENKIPVLFYPTFESILKMITSKVLIVDNYQWIFNLKYFLLYFCYKIQLWHGVGFKKLGRTLVYDKNDLPLGRRLKEFFGLYLEQLLPNYDLFITTSEFYSNKVFRPAFRMKTVVDLGYPRNDILLNRDKKLSYEVLINTDINALESIIKFKENNYKLVLYAPTYRESNNFRSDMKDSELTSLIKFGSENNIKFVFKSHPDHLNRFVFENDRVINYKYDMDIYPLLSHFDLLITDYSSIYMDYLLLNKPIIFYPYDIQEYIKNGRTIQFDYEWITPGPKCYNEQELIETVSQILVKNKDTYEKKREEILEIAFSNKDNNSSKRIWNYIETKVLSEY